MSTQYAHANNYTDNKADHTSGLSQDFVENNGGDEEEINALPLEAMVISNSALCAFMGARSPWANT